MVFPSISFRLSVVFSTVFANSAVFLPFFPPFLAFRGLSPEEIGLLFAAITVLKVFVAPHLGALADRAGDRRPAFVLYATLALISSLFLWKAYGFVPVILAAIFMQMFWNPVPTIVEAVASVHAARGAGDFGRMRSWGSATFVAVNFASGWYAMGRDPDWMLYGLWATFAATALAGLQLPPLPRGTKTSLEKPNVKLRDLIHVRGLLLFMLAASLTQGSHNMLYAFASLYWQAQGYSSMWIGVFWAAGVVAEILIFTFSARLSRNLRPGMWLMLGCIGAAVRWLVFPFAEGWLLWVLLQALHAFSFGATHIGAVQFITSSVRERQVVSAQSLYQTMQAIVATGVALIGGSLYAHLGGYAFAWMALLALAGVATALLGPAYARIGSVTHRGPSS